MKIQDSVVIVTGASMGIGEAVARALSEAGAKVVLAARSKEKIEQLATEIPNSLAVVTDARNTDDIRALIATTKEKFGRIDILINNAGQGLQSSVESVNVDDYRSVIELNVIGPLIAMQEVIPIMREQGSGMILNVSSMVSKNYYPGLAAYASTKYALNALSLTAREELKGDHITVSVFHPKMTATEFGQNASGFKYDSHAGRPGMTVDTPEQVAAAIVEQLQSEDAEANM